MILLLLYSTSFISFILFHSLAELATIIIAFGIFIVAWNFQKIRANNFILVIGVAYFFIAILDLLHTLSYQGIAIFQNNSNLPTQLWIAARYLESLSFVAAFIVLGWKRKLRNDNVFFVFLAITLFILSAIFFWKIFPAAFIEGTGLTPFKIASEYIISLFFLFAMWLLYENREKFDPRFVFLISFALAAKIFSELFFTQYVSVYGPSNLIGHLFKVFSFFLLYKAVLDIGLTDPYNVLFRELKQSEEKYRNLVDNTLMGVYRADLEGNYLYVNEAMAKMFEFASPEEVIHEGAKIRYENSKDRDKFLAELRKKGRITNYELSGKTRNGKIINILSSSILTGNEISGMILDITRRVEAESALAELNKKLEQKVAARTKALKERNELLEKFFKSEHILVAQIDKHFKFIRVNNSFAQLFNHQLKYFEGKNILKFINNKDFQKILLKAINSKKTIRIHEMPVRIRTADNEFSYWDLVLNPFRDRNSKSGFILTIIDVTENVRSKNSLIEYYQHLGVINRRISFLAEIEGQLGQKKTKKISNYLLSSSMKIAGASVGMIFRSSEESKNLELVASLGTNENQRKNISTIPAKSLNIFQTLVEKKARFQGYTEDIDISILNSDNKIRYFTVIPLDIHGKIRGFIFLGFPESTPLPLHELEFFDVFQRHASTALEEAKVLK